MSKNKQKIQRLTLAAFFIAIEVVMAYTPIGYIPVGALSITTMHLPVILAIRPDIFPESYIYADHYFIRVFAVCFRRRNFRKFLESCHCLCTKNSFRFPERGDVPFLPWPYEE